MRGYELAHTEASERQVTRDGRAERVLARACLKRGRLEASAVGDAATRAVLERVSRHDPGYRPAPTSPRPMDREGPSFGR